MRKLLYLWGLAAVILLSACSRKNSDKETEKPEPIEEVSPSSTENGVVAEVPSHKLVCGENYIADVQSDGTVRITPLSELGSQVTFDMESVEGWKNISSLRSTFEGLYAVGNQGAFCYSSQYIDSIREMCDSKNTSQIVSVANQVYEWPYIEAFLSTHTIITCDLWREGVNNLFLLSDGKLVEAYDRVGQNDFENIIEKDNHVVWLDGDYYLKKDGTIGTVLDQQYSPRGMESWSKVSEIAVNDYGVFGVQADGKVFAYPISKYSNSEVSKWKDVCSICAGGGVIMGLHTDGTVSLEMEASTGNNQAQDEVKSWSDVKEIATNGKIVAAKKADGSLVWVVLE